MKFDEYLNSMSDAKLLVFLKKKKKAAAIIAIIF